MSVPFFSLFTGLARSESFFGISPVRMVDDVYNVTSVYVKVWCSARHRPALAPHYPHQHAARAHDRISALHPPLPPSTTPPSHVVRRADPLTPCCLCFCARVVSVVQRGMDQLENELLEDPYTKKEPELIKRAVAQFYQRLFSALDKNVDKFEIYVVRNILKVPRHLDLSAMAGSSISASSATQAAEDELDAELEELRRKIHQSEYVNRAMEAKMQALQKDQQQYHSIKAVFDEAEQKMAGQSLPALEAAVSEVLCIEPEIRALEKQYRALDAERTKENVPMDVDSGDVETHFTRCKAQLGGTSTRALDELGTLLGAR